MKKHKKGIAGLFAALLFILAADTMLLFIVGMPRLEDEVMQREWQGLDLLEKYQENPDMAGWLQVEGTSINYPVMRGEKYLYRDFRRESNVSGSLFVEDDWTGADMCTLIYGHNMWMYGTMLNPLHRFADGDFFRRNRHIKFYVILDGGRSAEKRTYEILCCSKTSVDTWNYASCQYIGSIEELNRFLSDCRNRAVQRTDTVFEAGQAIVLSTCSYHVRGGKGRLLLTGSLTSRREQTKIDLQQKKDLKDEAKN
ncbi:MAG: class B sortase [Firmicutes bacterium]|nr:class B sortase [Bacillota bacterium]